MHSILSKYPLHMDLQLNKCTQSFPLTHEEQGSSECTFCKIQLQISQIAAEDIKHLHFCLLIGTNSCCLPLVSLQILKLQEANDDHLTFPANWRAHICLGVKVKSSSVIMNYAVSISIMKTSLVKKFLKFWKVFEIIFHS